MSSEMMVGKERGGNRSLRKTGGAPSHDPQVEGGFALLHQFLTTPLGLSHFWAFVDNGETYPLQTRVNSLKELYLLPGT